MIGTENQQEAVDFLAKSLFHLVLHVTRVVCQQFIDDKPLWQLNLNTDH